LITDCKDTDISANNKKKCIFLQKNLVVSEKSSTFARFFRESGFGGVSDGLFVYRLGREIFIL